MAVAIFNIQKEVFKIVSHCHQAEYFLQGGNGGREEKTTTKAKRT